MSTFENICGGFLAAGIVSAIVLGVVTVQTSLYYHGYPADPFGVKVVVGFLWYALIYQSVRQTIK
ncbi:uncharacterized protein EI90DRAFT_3124332 [Cantharellus anzutake]|uniref:uncharacterized protein n=1 Tax=Cantharellus anzutake TaxID=1750568 RepID=UPI0019047372|nr:uncharacterized protein EI90DRAFT_3124332 [Cantharellus anzutake]KAF8330305.1 hypothetical protein EI90DRAFT_3124332 [Cantharellus anzutake]